MPDEFLALPIASAREIAADQTLFTFDWPTAYARAYTTPGQFVKLAHGEAKPGFYVLASHPGESPAHLLIKESSEATAALRRLPAGTVLNMTAPMGKGFPLDKAKGKEVLLLAAGSGIAAIRPVLGYIQRHREAFGPVHLLYGERGAERFAFQEDLAGWAADGIAVHCCVSGPANGAAFGKKGYVQEILGSLALDTANTVGFICGMENMVVGCKAAFEGLGGDPAQLYLNY